MKSTQKGKDIGHFTLLTEEVLHLGSLPKFVLESVFLHLSPYEAMEVRGTCQEWNKIILENPAINQVHLLWERNKPTLGYRIRRLPFLYLNSRLCEILRVGVFRVALILPYSIMCLFMVFLASVALVLTWNVGSDLSTSVGDLFLLNYMAMPRESSLGFARRLTPHGTRRRTAANIVWNLLGFSLISSLFHVIMAILHIVSIIGWPNAIHNFTAAWMIFWPFGVHYTEGPLPNLPPADPRLRSLKEFSQVHGIQVKFWDSAIRKALIDENVLE